MIKTLAPCFVASGCKLPFFSWWPLQTHCRCFFSESPRPFPSFSSCNVNGQRSAVRQVVRLAIKEIAHMQPKRCKWGVYWLQSLGTSSSHSPCVLLLLSRISYCLASKPLPLACYGNSVS